jgi:hypothetical protein
LLQVGQEDGVDELGFAPGKLGDEGHVKLVFGEPIGELPQAQIPLGIVEIFPVQPLAVIRDAAREFLAPLAVSLEVIDE